MRDADRTAKRAGNSGYNFNSSGLATGISLLDINNFSGGIYGGYTSGGMDFRSIKSEISSSAGHFGATGRYTSDFGLIATLDMGYSRFNNRSKRNTDETPDTRGEFDQSMYISGISAGYEFNPWRNGRVTPFAALRQIRIQQDTYKETGPSASDVGKVSGKSVTSTFGVDVERGFVLHRGFTPRIVFTPGFNAGWRYEHADTYFTANTSEIGDPAIFSANSRESDRNFFLIGGSLSALFMAKSNAIWGLKFSYNAEVSKRATGHTVYGGIDLRF